MKSVIYKQGDIAKLVTAILSRDDLCKHDDGRLYYRVILQIGYANDVDVRKMSLKEFLLGLKDSGFPTFRTVIRTRQSIQQQYPDLR